MRLSGAHVKFCQNFLCQFWNENLIPLQYLYHSSISWKIIPLYFYSLNNIYFARKENIKMKDFETFKCSGQILSNSLCQFWNSNLIRLQIFYPSSVWWKIMPLYFFSSNNIYFARKENIKMKIFGTFKCSCQILSKFLMPILKRKFDSSPNFVPLFNFMKDYSSVLL